MTSKVTIYMSSFDSSSGLLWIAKSVINKEIHKANEPKECALLFHSTSDDTFSIDDSIVGSWNSVLITGLLFP